MFLILPSLVGKSYPDSSLAKTLKPVEPQRYRKRNYFFLTGSESLIPCESYLKKDGT